MILLFIAAATAAPGCEKLSRAITKDESELNQSLAPDTIQPCDCKGRQTQADLNVCSYRDYLRSDIALNRTSDAVTKRTAKDNRVFRTLLDGQRAWLTYRDKQCAVWAKQYEGGITASLMVNSCLINITEFRTKELSQLLADN